MYKHNFKQLAKVEIILSRKLFSYEVYFVYTVG